eukprot:scaffold2144_cov215-Pinguiococcus_pyrenoidosus.AAC.7
MAPLGRCRIDPTMATSLSALLSFAYSDCSDTKAARIAELLRTSDLPPCARRAGAALFAPLSFPLCFFMAERRET